MFIIERLLTQRLVQKNEELRKLYEQLYLLNSLFLKGKSNFNEKSLEIKNVTFMFGLQQYL